MHSISYLCIGIILGIVIERYIFPIMDLKLEAFQYKESEKATIYQLNAQELVAEFNREYPEFSQGETQELMPAIGFTYTPSEDEIYYEDD